MLSRMTVTGFKSIRSLRDFALGPVNVLIGANGAGKSNFLDFFRLLRSMLGFPTAELRSDPSLGAYVKDRGGMVNLLHAGPRTGRIGCELLFDGGSFGYRFGLDLTSSADFLINGEACLQGGGRPGGGWQELGGGSTRPILLDRIADGDPGACGLQVYKAIGSWQIYHFHDTSRLAGVRMPCDVSDNKRFRSDAANLPAFLYSLKEGDHGAGTRETVSGDGTVRRELLPNRQAMDSYERIVEAVKVIAPYFEDFILVPPKPDRDNLIRLQWRQKGSDLDMQAYHLSDGTLRFICLATTLLQPDPPGLLLIDEPELGLHPEALDVLAELIGLARERTQIIVSTQSPAFADSFAPEDIVVAARRNGETILRRLDSASLSGWLGRFSIGQLWRKNVIKGGVVNE